MLKAKQRVLKRSDGAIALSELMVELAWKKTLRFYKVSGNEKRKTLKHRRKIFQAVRAWR